MAAKLNRKLTEAKNNKKDEFYTQLSDISNELKHYRNHFKGKVVYCNCDDPRISNFFQFFALNFEKYGLKKLNTIAISQMKLLTEDKNVKYLEDKSKS